MPLLDHFHPPLTPEFRWQGFHSQWISMIVMYLNRSVLPRGFRAEPEVKIGAAVEVDVATLEVVSGFVSAIAVESLVYAPPQPPLTLPVDFAEIDTFEVRIHDDRGQRLAAAIELVSPANKDREEHRRAFVRKCASYLQEGVSLVLVDVVTERSGNLHAALVAALAPTVITEPNSSDALYAAAYRRITPKTGDRIDVWPVPLFVGQPLTTMPLWLTADLAAPLNLEESYRATCESLRIRVA